MSKNNQNLLEGIQRKAIITPSTNQETREIYKLVNLESIVIRSSHLTNKYICKAAKSNSLIREEKTYNLAQNIDKGDLCKTKARPKFFGIVKNSKEMSSSRYFKPDPDNSLFLDLERYNNEKFETNTNDIVIKH
ncbi:unnamed protein product [Brachionus calyciflorus]|uniref:Uncharacterized protein n=1 Tax=Brachionus calyciflorus TaxID=104777 RepID=A0A813UVR5_9BILA|nr:unnamed protein product [Brachionus calyciflorus]